MEIPRYTRDEGRAVTNKEGIKHLNYYSQHIFLCVNQKPAGKPCCADKGGELFFDYLKSRLVDLDMFGPGKIRVSKSGCLGRCALGPCLVIYPEGVWYRYESEEDIDEIINRQLKNNETIEHLLLNLANA